MFQAPFQAGVGQGAHDIDLTLLYAAYERKRLNVWMTLVATLVVGGLLAWVMPSRLLLLWGVVILAGVALGLVECQAFRRARPGIADLARWQRIFRAQMAFGGATWSVGPVAMLWELNLQGADLALLLSILFCVCAVAMASSAEQPSAMQAFLSATLLPVALAALLHGGHAELLVGVVMLFGLGTMIMVGRDSSRAMRIQLETQARLSAILNASQDAVISMDADCIITDWNARAELIFERTASEAKGLAFDVALIPESLRATYRAGLAHLLATGDEARMNERMATTTLRRDGRQFPVEITLSMVKSGRGCSFTAFVADISARKAGEERLALFRQVFDASNQCVGIADKNGCLLYQNLALARELGYADAEIIGKPFTFGLAGDSGAAFASQIRQAVQAGTGWAGQLPHRRKDGSIFISFSNIGFVKDKQGELQYIFNIFTDFSPELARRQQLALATEAAERANQAKSDFLSSMSHELRTPMNAIIGFAQMLEYDSGLNADQQDNVSEILRAGRHLLELINEVLDLAKIEAGEVHLSMEAIVLADLVEDCRQLMQPLAAARDIAMLWAVPVHMRVWADRVRLKQVLLNLLSNAIKYNRLGGSVRVCAQQQDAQQRLRLTIIDSGDGIARERMAELFQPFKRLDEEYGPIEGTGIGLTITRRLMGLMGGAVGVDSQVGMGSTFWIELRAEAEAAPASSATEAAPVVHAAVAAPQSTRSVLCIDDNPVNLKLLAQVFSLRPAIQLFSAHSPGLGLELALAHRPDLILLDINMPGMDGYQVLQVLKADPRLAATPVFAVTANAMPRDIARGIAAGFSEYVTKPIDIEPFLQSLDRYLVKRSAVI